MKGIDRTGDRDGFSRSEAPMVDSGPRMKVVVGVAVDAVGPLLEAIERSNRTEHIGDSSISLVP